MAGSELVKVIERLVTHYGVPKPPKLAGPWKMILWENVAYLADDDRRLKAFQTLKKEVSIEPAEILDASDKDLLEVARHGILPEQFAEKLRTCAKIALEEFDGNLKQVLKWPLPKAKKALQKFPGIGEPGAEKICFSRGPARCWLSSRTLCACSCGSDLRKSRRATRRPIGWCKRRSQTNSIRITTG